MNKFVKAKSRLTCHREREREKRGEEKKVRSVVV